MRGLQARRNLDAFSRVTPAGRASLCVQRLKSGRQRPRVNGVKAVDLVGNADHDLVRVRARLPRVLAVRYGAIRCGEKLGGALAHASAPNMPAEALAKMRPSPAGKLVSKEVGILNNEADALVHEVQN